MVVVESVSGVEVNGGVRGGWDVQVRSLVLFVVVIVVVEGSEEAIEDGEGVGLGRARSAPGGQGAKGPLRRGVEVVHDGDEGFLIAKLLLLLLSHKMVSGGRSRRRIRGRRLGRAGLETRRVPMARARMLKVNMYIGK